jgi:Fe-S-cluster containining protein
MKIPILHIIYDSFEKWSDNQTTVCKKGCASCCTQNVTITAIEGEEILRYAQDKGMSSWIADKLGLSRTCTPPKMTTNDFAKACLNGKDAVQETHHDVAPCPFLEKDICMIYPVRHFGCRFFVSTVLCSTDTPAQMTDVYFEASMAVNQLIEHLGQKEYWGNMLDVLPALCDISEFKDIATSLDVSLSRQARMRTLTAKPLPGFLLSEQDGPEVMSLLETIFDTSVDNMRIEDILNGK